MWRKRGRATAYNGSDLHPNRVQLRGALFKIEHRRRSGCVCAPHSHRRGHWLDPSIATKTIRIFGLSERLLVGEDLRRPARRSRRTPVRQHPLLPASRRPQGHNAMTVLIDLFNNPWLPQTSWPVTWSLGAGPRLRTLQSESATSPAADIPGEPVGLPQVPISDPIRPPAEARTRDPGTTRQRGGHQLCQGQSSNCSPGSSARSGDCGRQPIQNGYVVLFWGSAYTPSTTIAPLSARSGCLLR
jgi:hypothetical protein